MTTWLAAANAATLRGLATNRSDRADQRSFNVGWTTEPDFKSNASGANNRPRGVCVFMPSERFATNAGMKTNAEAPATLRIPTLTEFDGSRCQLAKPPFKFMRTQPNIKFLHNLS
jgi:hypothetical protein